MILQDWQKGEESKIPALQRSILHNEWLKEIHKELQDKIRKVEEPIKEEVVGFVED